MLKAETYPSIAGILYPAFESGLDCSLLGEVTEWVLVMSIDGELLRIHTGIRHLGVLA